jgi:hypothetical protein
MTAFSRLGSRLRDLAHQRKRSHIAIANASIAPSKIWRRWFGKSPIFMDDEVIGLGIQVRETGRKTFTLDYAFEGRRGVCLSAISRIGRRSEDGRFHTRLGADEGGASAHRSLHLHFCIIPVETDCMAGVGGLELRNPCASHVFEKT